MEGHTLADGFADFPKAFPEIYRATVSAGEQSGHLDAVLERLADYTEGRQVLRQKIQHAMIYPVVLTGGAAHRERHAGLCRAQGGRRVLDNSGELPGLTVFLIALSDFMRDYGLLLVAGLVAAGFARAARPSPDRVAGVTRCSSGFPSWPSWSAARTPRASRAP